MGNVLNILKRDILRLLRAPAALIVVGALMVLPSLYTWYNVVAFWNPYEATGNLSVSVVNEDAGAKTDLTGALNVGDTVVDELAANDKLHFVEQDRDAAMADLKSGDVFAVYVIPEDFTKCLVSPVTGQVKTPQIIYYANEKLGPVSPKITDTAASTLEQTINSMFVATVSEAATQAIDEAIDKAEAAGTAARERATTNLDAAAATVTDVRTKLAEAQSALDTAKTKTESAATSLDGTQTLVTDAKTLIRDAETEAYAVQSALASASSTTVNSLSGIASNLSQIVAKAGTAADGLAAKAGSAHALVDVGAGRMQPLVDTLTNVSQDLQDTAASLPDGDPAKAGIQNAATDLGQKATELQSTVDAASALAAKLEETSQTASNTAETLETTSKQMSDSLATYSNDLLGSTAPTITSILTQVNSSCALLSATATDIETTIDEAQTGLRQLGGLLANCSDALKQTDELIGGTQADIDSIASDIRLLAQSNTIAELVEGGSLNAQNIGEFMGSPTKLETVQLYHPNAYGTAMAPLFMNLTFWIGAFMLVIIFRTEVDDEGIRNITLGQRYFSRLILFAGIAIVQAVICCAGVLALGVQVANVPALFLAAALAALAFLSIIYALSQTLQHIGKALCIILVFAQIPGGSGLYPLELTDGFFQAIYPFLPFSYGIDAIREAIGGFYGNFFARDMIVLAVIAIGVTILGSALVPAMSNVTRMAARQIHEGDLYNSEDAAVPERPYYLTKMVGAVSDRKDLRQNIERRYARFSRMYPVFIRASIVLAIGVPAALALMLALEAGEKVVLITIVMLWLIALLVFVLIVESLRSSFERQLNLKRELDTGTSKFYLDFGLPVSVSTEALQPGTPQANNQSAQNETRDAAFGEHLGKTHGAPRATREEGDPDA